MGRPRKKPIYVVADSDILASVNQEDELILDFESEDHDDPEDNLLDRLQCPIADDVLIALRKAFSLTYPRNPFVDGLNEALMDIRRVGTEALKEIPDVLVDMGLNPVPTPMQESRVGKAFIFKYSLARSSDLRVQVKYEGKRRSLLTLMEPLPADGVIKVLRDIVSDTFSEMYDEDQHEAVLLSIRERIWEVLPQFNDILDEIEVEPIARKEPQRENPTENHDD